MINKWVNCSVVSDSFDPIDYSLPGSSAHGILQARILEWVAIPFSRGISSTRDRTWVSRIASRFFNKWGQHIPWEQLSLPHLDLLLFSDTDCHHGILLCVFIVSSLKKVFQGCFSLLLNRPLLNEFMVTGLVGEEDVGKRYRVWDQHVHTAIFKTCCRHCTGDFISKLFIMWTKAAESQTHQVFTCRTPHNPILNTRLGLQVKGYDTTACIVSFPLKRDKVNLVAISFLLEEFLGFNITLNF